MANRRQRAAQRPAANGVEDRRDPSRVKVTDDLRDYFERRTNRPLNTPATLADIVDGVAHALHGTTEHARTVTETHHDGLDEVEG